LHARVRALAARAGGGRRLEDADIDLLLDSPVGQQARHMLTYTAVGDGPAVVDYLERFAELADADELMITNPAPGLEKRRRALQILADIAA
ncbi:MAG TPA: alkane 1-monooxygenase, partial [Intrasporangiaceae bacterium]|nr:alkane 1-monooxygenase [Intrasporangiaceae bacterium]